MANEIIEWHPPQEKIVRKVVTGTALVALVVGAAVAVKAVVPTVSDALVLLQHMLANGISMAMTAAGLAAVLWFIYETFSPQGKINGLISQVYSSFIHNMTLELLNVDPMSPLKDSLTAVKAKKAFYDEQFAMFDGQISRISQSVDDFRDKAAKAESRAKAAQATGDKKMFDQFAYEAGSSRETADNISKMMARLATIRTIIVRLQEAAGDLIYKLQIDIESTQVQWDTAQSMSRMEGAARKIISSSGKSDLAREAQSIVNAKYASALGRLENLNDAAMPLLNSIDMDKATYSQELLDRWDAEQHGPTVQALAAPGLMLADNSISGTKSFSNLI